MIQSFLNLTKLEWGLWLVSVTGVLLSGLWNSAFNPLILAACLVGVTALIFVAKGDVLGQILTVVFSVFYGIISYSFQYFGEMITYLFMTAPMALLAVISWLRHPFQKGKREVEVNTLKPAERILIWVAAAFVTLLFYYILAALGTANLVPSTISVATSFLAAYLTFRRSPFYALAYAANDLVLTCCGFWPL